MFKILLGLSDYQSGVIKIGDHSSENGKGDLSQARKKMGFFIGTNLCSSPITEPGTERVDISYDFVHISVQQNMPKIRKKHWFEQMNTHNQPYKQ